MKKEKMANKNSFFTDNKKSIIIIVLILIVLLIIDLSIFFFKQPISVINDIEVNFVGFDEGYGHMVIDTEKSFNKVLKKILKESGFNKSEVEEISSVVIKRVKSDDIKDFKHLVNTDAWQEITETLTEKSNNKIRFTKKWRKVTGAIEDVEMVIYYYESPRLENGDKLKIELKTNSNSMIKSENKIYKVKGLPKIDSIKNLNSLSDKNLEVAKSKYNDDDGSKYSIKKLGDYLSSSTVSGSTDFLCGTIFEVTNEAENSKDIEYVLIMHSAPLNNLTVETGKAKIVPSYSNKKNSYLQTLVNTLVDDGFFEYDLQSN